MGYRLAEAIFNAEVSKTEILSAYETLMEYQDSGEFHNAIVKLKNVLDNDEYILAIAEGTGLSRPEVQEILKNIP